MSEPNDDLEQVMAVYRSCITTAMMPDGPSHQVTFAAHVGKVLEKIRRAGYDEGFNEDMLEPGEEEWLPPVRDWMVMSGCILDTTAGSGGFEFFGPFTEEEAHQVRERFAGVHPNPNAQVIAVQLLTPPGVGLLAPGSGYERVTIEAER